MPYDEAGRLWSNAITNLGNNVAESIRYYQQRHEQANQLDRQIQFLGEMKGPDDKPILDKKSLERIRGHTDKERYANELAFMEAFKFRNSLLQEGTKLAVERAKIRAATQPDFYTSPDGTKYFYGARGWQKVGGGATPGQTGVAQRFQVKEIDKQIKDMQKLFSDEGIPDAGMMLDSKRHYGGTQDKSGKFVRGTDPSKYNATGVDTGEGEPVVFPTDKFNRLQQQAQELQRLQNERMRLIKAQSGIGTDTVRVRLSTGRSGKVPRAQLNAWRQRDPGLQVIEDQPANAAPSQSTDESDEDTDNDAE